MVRSFLHFEICFIDKKFPLARRTSCEVLANESLHWPLLAESGSQNLVFPMFLTCAGLPVAAIGMVES